MAETSESQPTTTKTEVPERIVEPTLGFDLRGPLSRLELWAFVSMAWYALEQDPARVLSSVRKHVAQHGADGEIARFLAGAPSDAREALEKLGCLLKAGEPPVDQDQNIWFAASLLAPDEGIHLSKVKALCERHGIRFRKPSPQRLEIHVGDWARYWVDKQKADFEGRDNRTDNSSASDRGSQYASEVAERQSQVRARKQGSGPAGG